MSADERTDPGLRNALEAALGSCRQALGDYQAGLLDDGQLQRELLRAGVVARPDEVWLLDLHGARWCRYDGLGLGAAGRELPATDRLRHVVDTLADELVQS